MRGVYDCRGMVEPNDLACLAHKSPCRVGRSPRGQPKGDEPPVLVDGQRVRPTAVHTEVRFVYSPAGDHKVICRDGTCHVIPRHLRRRLDALFRIWGSNSWTQRYTVAASTAISLSAGRSRTSRRVSGDRHYRLTARRITPLGTRWPKNGSQRGMATSPHWFQALHVALPTQRTGPLSDCAGLSA